MSKQVSIIECMSDILDGYMGMYILEPEIKKGLKVYISDLREV